MDIISLIIPVLLLTSMHSSVVEMRITTEIGTQPDQPDEVCHSCDETGKCVHIRQCNYLADEHEAWTSSTFITLTSGGCSSPLENRTFCFPLYHWLVGTHPIICDLECVCTQVEACP